MSHHIQNLIMNRLFVAQSWGWKHDLADHRRIFYMDTKPIAFQ